MALAPTAGWGKHHQATERDDYRRDIMNMAGPEDALAVQVDTAPMSWRFGPVTNTVLTKQLPTEKHLELTTLATFLQTAPYSGILTGLMKNRNLCSVPRHQLEVCKQQYPAHLAVSQCAPATLATTQCGIKLARKVQYECKQQVKDLAACYKASNNSRAACFQEYVAFDTCTEEF